MSIPSPVVFVHTMTAAYKIRTHIEGKEIF